MSTLFTLKKNTILPKIELTLTPSGYTYDMAEATGIEFRYRKKEDSTVEVIELDIVDAAAKTVLLTPTAELVDTIGKFDCHVKLTFPTGTMRIPQKGFDKFEITEDF